VALAATGCGTTLIADDIKRDGDSWTMTLQRLRDGPNQFTPSGNTTYHPDSGNRFIFAYVKFRNDAPVARVFSYQACDLDAGNDVIIPSMISRYNGIATVLDDKESYDPGEVSNRILVFTYPEGRMPTRLRCAYVTFAIPPAPP
jgi:hypothetical protein